MPNANLHLKHLRDGILDRLLGILQRDERVRAVWLSGSLGRGNADDWSDIDIHVAVTDADLDAWHSERPQLHQAVGHPVLVLPDKFHPPAAGSYQGILFAGPVFVDLNLVAASEAHPKPDTRILLDRLPLPTPAISLPEQSQQRADLAHNLGRFWKMTQIVLKYTARGDLQKATIQFWILQDAFANCWRLIHQPERADAGSALWLHPTLDAKLSSHLPALGDSINARSLLNAISWLMDELIALHPDIERFGIPVPTDAVAELTRFRDTIAPLLQ